MVELTGDPLSKKKHAGLLIQIYTPVLFFLGLALIVAIFFCSSILKHQAIEFHLQSLKNISSVLKESKNWNERSELKEFSDSHAGTIFTRISFFDQEGHLIVDSLEDPIRYKNMNWIDSIRELTSQEYKKSTPIRLHWLSGEKSIMIATPINIGLQEKGVLLLSREMGVIEEDIQNRLLMLYAIFISIFLIIVIGVYWILKKFSRSLSKLTDGAERYARGEMGFRVEVPLTEETGRLALAMNEMAVQLQERVTTIDRQRQEHEAVFANMREGVMALGSKGRIMSLNDSSLKLLNCSREEALGRTLGEAFRNTDILKMEKKIRKGGGDQQRDILGPQPSNSIFEVKGTKMLSSEGEFIGTLFVFNDVTRLRRLENMRKQFVANVSHELKTPLTSIKGYVETLMNPAPIDEKSAKNFIEKIGNNANRLHYLFEDLLTLSRIEQEGLFANDIHRVSVSETLINVKSELEKVASDKKIKINIFCDRHLCLEAHPMLLHQAILNLTDNAIKYANSKEVILSAGENEVEVYVHIQDFGEGISEEHLEHLFERFYRVDKARSRKMGGTGLGLSIVKHIIQAHGGRVEVHSKAGQGSTFCIILPKTSSLHSDHLESSLLG